MADALDAPTVYRDGPPTLGVPVFSVVYRPGVAAVPAPPAEDRAAAVLGRYVDTLERRLARLESRVAALEVPWYRRVYRWILHSLGRAT